MREAEVRDIAGKAYEVTPCPAGVGLKLMLRLGKVLGPVAGLVGNREELEAMAGAVVAEVLERASEEDLEAIWRPLAAHTQVTTSGPGGEVRRPKLAEVFDVWFAGDYAALAQWLMFALEVNFGPLWQWLATLPGAGAARADAAKA